MCATIGLILSIDGAASIMNDMTFGDPGQALGHRAGLLGPRTGADRQASELVERHRGQRGPVERLFLDGALGARRAETRADGAQGDREAQESRPGQGAVARRATRRQGG